MMPSSTTTTRINSPMPLSCAPPPPPKPPPPPPPPKPELPPPACPSAPSTGPSMSKTTAVTRPMARVRRPVLPPWVHASTRQSYGNPRLTGALSANRCAGLSPGRLAARPAVRLGGDGVSGRTPVTPPFGRLRGPDHMYTPATHGRTRTRVPEFRMLLVHRAAGNVVFKRLFGSVWAAEVDLA
jgi:hypothetical protein